MAQAITRPGCLPGFFNVCLSGNDLDVESFGVVHLEMIDYKVYHKSRQIPIVNFQWFGRKTCE